MRCLKIRQNPVSLVETLKLGDLLNLSGLRLVRI